MRSHEEKMMTIPMRELVITVFPFPYIALSPPFTPAHTMRKPPYPSMKAAMGAANTYMALFMMF